MAIDPMCFFIPVALIAEPIPGKESHWSKQRPPRLGSGHATMSHPEYERAELGDRAT
jgi:hypothetical protein